MCMAQSLQLTDPLALCSLIYHSQKSVSPLFYTIAMILSLPDSTSNFLPPALLIPKDQDGDCRTAAAFKVVSLKFLLAGGVVSWRRIRFQTEETHAYNGARQFRFRHSCNGQFMVTGQLWTNVGD
ncbi:hypothetical protein Tcan_00117 [Toxocara canis]|uniref:Uncharacterized protein n=1 Tax=Toxocara canis TaxID=6265 RepID=A0A0B2UNH2_TOXCA|nr:hypothetical protein Tcan_00117 [Toxocara canis]